MRYAQKRCLQIYSIDKAHIYSNRKLENKNYTKKQKEKREGAESWGSIFYSPGLMFLNSKPLPLKASRRETKLRM